jgi:glutathione S-transferase
MARLGFFWPQTRATVETESERGRRRVIRGTARAETDLYSTARFFMGIEQSLLDFLSLYMYNKWHQRHHVGLFYRFYGLRQICARMAARHALLCIHHTQEWHITGFYIKISTADRVINNSPQSFGN